jgi:hypothetical protein
MEQQISSVSRSKNIYLAILVTWLLAGTLDLISAIVVSGAPPERILRAIASGAFGRDEAFSGGFDMVVWGFLFHYFIAFSWTVLFFLLYPKLSILRKNKYIVGLVYGVFVWTIMNLVVIRLSQIVPRPFNFTSALTQATILMLMIGLPISILANRFYTAK